MKKWTSIWAIALVLMSAGCRHRAPSQDHPMLDMPPSPQVKPAPPLHPEALDPSLRQSALNELLAESDSDDPFLRSNAIEGLAEASPSDAALPALKGLSDPKPNVRFAAAIAVGQLHLKQGYQPLLAMVEDPDLRVQAAVRFALHRLGDTRFSHDLERLSTDPDPRVRAATAQVLGILQEPSAVKILKPLLRDPSQPTRLQAAEALWRLGDQEGLEALVAYSISAYPDDQIIAITALAEPRDQRVIGQIRGDLTSDYLEVSLAAARAMGMLDSDEGWYVAVPTIKSDDPRQRSLAALALGAIGRSDSQSILAPLLKDKEPLVRISAATAILQLHGS